jgi:hypothetical protein
MFKQPMKEDFIKTAKKNLNSLKLKNPSERMDLPNEIATLSKEEYAEGEKRYIALVKERSEKAAAIKSQRKLA